MALFKPNKPKTFCLKCNTELEYPMVAIGMCRRCFEQNQVIRKSVEERLLDLEIAIRQPHSHLENKRF